MVFELESGKAHRHTLPGVRPGAPRLSRPRRAGVPLDQVLAYEDQAGRSHAASPAAGPFRNGSYTSSGSPPGWACTRHPSPRTPRLSGTSPRSSTSTRRTSDDPTHLRRPRCGGARGAIGAAATDPFRGFGWRRQRSSWGRWHRAERWWGAHAISLPVSEQCVLRYLASHGGDSWGYMRAIARVVGVVHEARHGLCHPTLTGCSGVDLRVTGAGGAVAALGGLPLVVSGVWFRVV